MSDVATGQLRIRRAEPADYNEAGEVTALAYTSSYPVLSEGYVASLRDAAGRAQRGEIWLAEDDEGIVGTVWVAADGSPLSPVALPGETDFRQLAVAPRGRGRGIGAALVRHVIAIAQERGSQRVIMNSGPEMTAAHALYAKLGFVRVPEREGRVEVEPGRVVDLLTFSIDVEPRHPAPA